MAADVAHLPLSGDAGVVGGETFANHPRGAVEGHVRAGQLHATVGTDDPATDDADVAGTLRGTMERGQPSGRDDGIVVEEENVIPAGGRDPLVGRADEAHVGLVGDDRAMAEVLSKVASRSIHGGIVDEDQLVRLRGVGDDALDTPTGQLQPVEGDEDYAGKHVVP